MHAQIFGQIHDTSIGYSQTTDNSVFNYVQNPSFEEYSECPDHVDQLNKCLYWQRVPGLLDSPDYFHRCANININFNSKLIGVPYNVFGYQNPRSGDAYSGIITFEKGYYQEYIQNHLKKPLTKGEVYVIGMYVSLSNKAKYANDRFRFCLTSNPKLEKQSRVYKGIIDIFLICPSGTLFKNETQIIDSINWINIKTEYKAIGGEEFLTIGVFDGDIKWWDRFKMRRKIINKNWSKYNIKVPYAYYYIDDVYVIRKEDYLKMKEYDKGE
jgi:OmpA-OmpF porin, OOP family